MLQNKPYLCGSSKLRLEVILTVMSRLENMQPPVKLLMFFFFFTLKPLLKASLVTLHSINDYVETIYSAPSKTLNILRPTQ